MKNPRILAVFAIDWSRAETFGLLEKAVGLVNAARRQGFEVDAYFPDGMLLHEYRAAPPYVASARGWQAALFRYSGFWRKLTNLLEHNYDFVWLRAFPPSRAQARFIRRAHAQAAQVVVDVPTYPVTQEGQSPLRSLLARLSPSYAELSQHLARVVTLSEDKVLFGRPTIQVANGVDALPTADRPPHEGPYRLVGFGQWAHWHGLDRLLHMLAAAPADENYQVRLAGHGPAVAEARQLARELGVTVEWLPPAYGAAREALLSWADVGVGCLAIHRKGVYPDQALKHRQYAAAGLPFIATVADPTWADQPAVWRLSSDEKLPAAGDLGTFCEAARQHRELWTKSLSTQAELLSWDASYAALWAYFRESSHE